MPGGSTVTYKDLYQQVIEEIERRGQFSKTASRDTQFSRDSVAPLNVVGGGAFIGSIEVGDLIRAIQNIIRDTIPGTIIEGLRVRQTNPPSDSVVIEPGKGAIAGRIYEIEEEVLLPVQFNLTTSVFFVNLHQNAIKIEANQHPEKLTIAKIIVPSPEDPSLPVFIRRVFDQKQTRFPFSLDAYIVNLRLVKLFEDGTGKLEEDSIDFLRDNISPILADNLIGNIRLREDLQIINTAGTMKLDSSSLKFFDPVNNLLLSRFDRRGSFFFNSSGVEVAKFATDGALIGNIKIFPNSIQSGNFVSGPLGAGFQIKDDGDAEFNNVLVRGALKAAVFQKDTISVVGGNLLVLDGDVLDEDMGPEDDEVLVISGATTLSPGDRLRIKNGVDDEWFQVIAQVSGQPNTYQVERDKDEQFAPNENPAWPSGSAVANFSQPGEGGIFLTASESNAPHIDIFSHAGEPWDLLTTHMRMGNLNGFLDFTEDRFGVAIGDSNRFLKYDPVDGLRIQGTIFVTGGNAAVTFFQTEEPSGIGEKEGDYWIDTNDSNALHTFQSGVWVRIAEDEFTRRKVFAQDEEPTSGVGLIEGDLWIDTNDDNRLYRWNGIFWVSIRDATIAEAITDAATAQATADGKITTFFQDDEPTSGQGLGVGDLWIDTNDGNKLFRYDGNTWIEVQDNAIAQAIAAAATAQSTADGKIVSFYQDEEPPLSGQIVSEGDIWIDTNNDDKLSIFQDGVWRDAQDIGSKVFRQDEEPTSGQGIKQGDFWIDTNDNDRLRTFSEILGEWVLAQAEFRTFRQSRTGSGEGVPLARNAGDLWIDTDTNKLFRASNAGDDEVKIGEWEVMTNAGMDEEGNLISKVLPGDNVDPPPSAGLFMGADFMGFHNGTEFRVFIKNDGDFTFKGDDGNFVSWDGVALTVRGTLNADDIVAGFLSVDRIVANSINAADKIIANTITANEINVSQLSAITADMGTLTAGSIIGAIIKTAVSGRRIELDTNGLFGFDAANNRRFGFFLTALAGQSPGDFVIGNKSTNKFVEWDDSLGALTVRGVLNADDITAGFLSVDRIQANTITANEIRALTIIAGNIANTTITPEKAVAGAFDTGLIMSESRSFGRGNFPVSNQFFIMSEGANEIVISRGHIFLKRLGFNRISVRFTTKVTGTATYQIGVLASATVIDFSDAIGGITSTSSSSVTSETERTLTLDVSGLTDDVFFRLYVVILRSSGSGTINVLEHFGSAFFE